MKALMLIGVLLLAGCGPLIGGKPGDESYYVIMDHSEAPPVYGSTHALRLLIRDMKASQFINSRKIVFSETSATRGYYQFARWVEPPPDRLTLLLLERCERARIFSAVSRLASSSLGDLQLNTELIEFYHDIQHSPGKVVIKINAELIDLKNRTSLYSRTFEREIEVNEYSAAGAVTAFSQGVSEILDELLVWLDKSVDDLAQSGGAR